MLNVAKTRSGFKPASEFMSVGAQAPVSEGFVKSER